MLDWKWGGGVISDKWCVICLCDRDNGCVLCVCDSDKKYVICVCDSDKGCLIGRGEGV